MDLKDWSFLAQKHALYGVFRAEPREVVNIGENTRCTALPGVKFLSNPRRMHSKGEGEEKEEQGLPRAPSCCSTTFPAPSPSPPHTRCEPTGLHGTRYQDTSPPPPL
jgi:hypothetical protein